MESLQLDHASPVPLYFQLRQQLRAAITGGQLRQGDMIPTEAEISRRTGVSRPTIRQAIDELVREGMLWRRRGQGTFVGTADRRPPTPSFSFASVLQASDGEWKASVVSTALIAPNEDLRPLAALGSGEVLEVVRVIQDSAGPCAVERLLLPALEVTQLALEHGRSNGGPSAFYAHLEQQLGLQVSHAEESVSGVLLDADHAAALDVPPASPGLLLQRRTYAGDQLIEVRRIYMRGERARFTAVVPRSHLSSV